MTFKSLNTNLFHLLTLFRINFQHSTKKLTIYPALRFIFGNWTLKTRVDNIEVKLKSTDTTTSFSKDTINNELLLEMIDRQNSLKNVLLFNLPESNNNSINETSDPNII